MIIIIIIIIIIIDCPKNGWKKRKSPTAGNNANGGSSPTTTNRLWIWRWVSWEIKRNEKEKRNGMTKKMRGACGNGCSKGEKKN